MRLSPAQYEDVVRTMIHRENEVINHRVNWLTAVQGLLFAALGVSWDRVGVEPFVVLLCCVGVSMALIMLLALHGATRAMRRLYEWWEVNRPPDYAGPDVIGLPLLKSRLSRNVGPWISIPILFIIAWIVVWYIKG